MEADVKVKLLQPRGNYKAGAVIDCAWACVARQWIADGAALAVESCDQHLNPPDAAAPAPEADAAPAPRTRKRK